MGVPCLWARVRAGRGLQAANRLDFESKDWTRHGGGEEREGCGGPMSEMCKAGRRVEDGAEVDRMAQIATTEKPSPCSPPPPKLLSLL